MTEDTKTETAAVTAQPEQHVQEGVDDGMDYQPSSSKIVRFYSHPWTQIVLISVPDYSRPERSKRTLLTRLTRGRAIG
jgi:hypothetical protein